MKKQPLYLTVFKPGPEFESSEPLVMSTPVSMATTEYQANLQNQLCKEGETETILGISPDYLRSKLARALTSGFIFGALAASASFIILR